MVKHFIIIKTIKKLGNSKGIILTPDELKSKKLDVGKTIGIELHEVKP